MEARSVFLIEPTKIVDAKFAARRKDLMTFRGRSIENPNHRIHIVFTERDFHLIGECEEGTFWVHPFKNGEEILHASFYAKDEVIPDISCTQHPNPDGEELEFNQAESSVAGISWGTELRKFRFAILFPSSTSAAYGNDTTAIVNRAVQVTSDMNFVLEKELCVTYELAPDPEKLVFTDPANDPYSGLGSITGIINGQIGSANYEIGKAIAGSGGGVSYLGVTCGGNKAGSLSSNSHWVIVHEMGHNMGGGHTFNYCPGWGGTDFEPGAGNSILSYGGTGVCGQGHWVPGGRINYFHTSSVQEMHNKLFNNTNCSANTATGNNPPVVTVPAGGFSIPKLTPFTLTGSATDPDGDVISDYRWEQYNYGTGAHPANPTATDPLFRMFPPSTVPTRTIPRINEIINGYNYGELLPEVARSLTFRFYARDGFAGGEGIAYDEMSFLVEGNAGPFEVVYPNEGTEKWAEGQTVTVTWDVANTDVAPVSCSLVNILLSKDGGFNFTDTLATAVANDGSHDVVVPNGTGTQNRIKVEANDNIFFDISDNNFEIVAAGTQDFIVDALNDNQSICPSDISVDYFN